MRNDTTTTTTSGAAAACPEPFIRHEERNGRMVPYEVTPLASGVRITRTSQQDVDDAWDAFWAMDGAEYAEAFGLDADAFSKPLAGGSNE